MEQWELESHIDTTELLGLAKALQAIDPASKKAMTRALRAMGNIVAAEAKQNVLSIPALESGGTVRSRIASAIGVSVSGLKVKVVQRKVSYHVDLLSKLWELGGTDNRGYWRHPVFGDKRVKVIQQARPYFFRAAQEHEEEVELAGYQAIQAGLAAFEHAKGNHNG